ncbi:hypothetical protein [Mesobacillus jeotgali]|uniref:hypothetical protein n=1 Tax=Mesobacillus jeotgali TaxID=129985 RepID=UPI0017822F5D|nr:hypothetical protein [Mesobacillus jeotgali]UYZ21762.1 hypothetical protein FOF60_22650 [Mesobacillus jeotgali]
MEPIGLTAFAITTRFFGMVNSNRNINEVLSQMIIFYEEQEKVLETIKMDLETMKKGPIFSAKTYLLDASKSYRTVNEQQELVWSAKDKFIDALGILQAKSHKNYEDHYFLCINHLYISMCWDLLHKTDDSTDWIISSLKECNAATLLIEQEIGSINREQQKLKQKLNVLKEKITKGATSTAVLFLAFAPLALAKDYPKYKEKIRVETRLKIIEEKLVKVQFIRKILKEIIESLTQVLEAREDHMSHT